MHTTAGTRLPAVGLVVSVLITLAQPLAAAIEVASNGQDGALSFTSTTVIDLANPAIATDAPWDAATPGIAACDSTMWAVVFHYPSVNVAVNVGEYGTQNQYGDHLVFSRRKPEMFCRKQLPITHNGM